MVDRAVADYVEAIPAEFRLLFDRLHRLILEACPEATLVMSYKMPTYKLGSRRLHLGVWKHGVSIYGWKRQGDGGFTAAHPELQTSTGTIQLRPEEAVLIADDEFRDLVRAALGRPVPDL
jgi:uncharacterized protein YdhG (YjbR/CyaY superfamily)